MARNRQRTQSGSPSISQIIKSQEKFMLYDEREHLKHPIPRPMEIRAIGAKLTEIEWNKFCNNSLKHNKYLDWCDRKHDGSIIFFGETGIDAAVALDKKFPGRFNFVMDCIDKERALVGTALSREKDLTLREVTFMKTRGVKQSINDPVELEKLSNNGGEKINNMNVKLA